MQHERSTTWGQQTDPRAEPQTEWGPPGGSPEGKPAPPKDSEALALVQEQCGHISHSCLAGFPGPCHSVIRQTLRPTLQALGRRETTRKARLGKLSACTRGRSFPSRGSLVRLPGTPRATHDRRQPAGPPCVQMHHTAIHRQRDTSARAVCHFWAGTFRR